MAEKGIAPAAPAAPSTPAPAAPAAPAAAASKPAVTRPARPAAPARPVSTIPKQEPRPKLSAKKALGLEDTPRKMAQDVTRDNRARFAKTQPSVELPVEPATPAPAAPAVTAPAEPAAPAAPAEPAAPAKMKVGDKEYTEAELQEFIAKSNAPAPAAPAPAATPAPEPVEEEPAAPAPLSAEEVAKREQEFLRTTSETLDAPMTEEEIDSILAGGKEAIATMQTIRKRDMANAILQARKGVAGALNPVMTELFNALKPLVANHQQIQRYSVEQQFVAKHKDFVPHVETARAIAEELVRRFPEQVNRMSQDQFIDEVARQTDLHLSREHKRWFPQGNGNWRGSGATAAPAVPSNPVAPSPAIPAAAPAPAAPAERIVRAPAANVPGGITSGGGMDWKKAVASSLRG